MPLKSASVPRSPGSASPPYPSTNTRRTSSQPKSSRQQFSACGACRMRRYSRFLAQPTTVCSVVGNRVRCDLKDLPFSSTGTQPQCSNCKERGLKCVSVPSPGQALSFLRSSHSYSDEFAEVKAVKLLRRGRRLQQVEFVSTLTLSSPPLVNSFCRAVYGKTIDEDGGLFAPPSLSPGLIPRLKPEFFSSAFFRRFHIQRQSFSLSFAHLGSYPHVQILSSTPPNFVPASLSSARATAMPLASRASLLLCCLPFGQQALVSMNMASKSLIMVKPPSAIAVRPPMKWSRKCFT
jgi:hypothetical protein